MSTLAPVTIGCPECGAAISGQIVICANLPRLPAAVEALKADRFNQLSCGCGKRVRYQRAVAAVDFRRRLWVYCWPRTCERHWVDLARLTEGAFRKNMAIQAPAMIRDQADAWLTRTVFGYEALREKVVLWEAGLDDVQVEQAKLWMLRGQPRWAYARFRLRKVDAEHLYWEIERLDRERDLAKTARALLDQGPPPDVLPGALGCDPFVDMRRFFVEPLPAPEGTYNFDGIDVATGGGDPRQPRILPVR